MSDHPLCCDCDGCLNGAGGLVLAGAGKTRIALPHGEDKRRARRKRMRQLLKLQGGDHT